MLYTVILLLTNTTTTWLLPLDTCVSTDTICMLEANWLFWCGFKWHCFYYTLYAVSAFSLVKSLQLILKINATNRLVSYLLEANWLTYRSCAQCIIHDFQERCQTVFHATVCLSLFPSNNKTIITIILDSVLVIFKVLNIVLSLGW